MVLKNPGANIFANFTRGAVTMYWFITFALFSSYLWGRFAARYFDLIREVQVPDLKLHLGRIPGA